MTMKCVQLHYFKLKMDISFPSHDAVDTPIITGSCQVFQTFLLTRNQPLARKPSISRSFPTPQLCRTGVVTTTPTRWTGARSVAQADSYHTSILKDGVIEEATFPSRLGQR